MVNNSAQLDRVFSALSDPTRRSTLAQLARGPATVGELAASSGLSPAGFSKHIKVLLDAGLLAKELQGRRHCCRLRTEGLRAASEWISLYQRFWSEALDGLEEFLGSPGEGRADG